MIFVNSLRRDQKGTRNNRSNNFVVVLNLNFKDEENPHFFLGGPLVPSSVSFFKCLLWPKFIVLLSSISLSFQEINFHLVQKRETRSRFTIAPGNKSEVWNIELKMAFSDKVKDVVYREFKIRQHLEIFTHNPKNKVYLNKLGL